MKAIAIIPSTLGSRIVERPEPTITAPDEVKVKVIRVGICGTDRTEVSGGRADAPDGQKELVIGHEDRTHLGLEKETPGGRIRSAASGRILSHERLGGLHHRYERAA